jgi:uncharacterized protein YoxC
VKAFEIAALLAAASFALVAVVGAFALVKLIRVLSKARDVMSEFHGGSEALLARANAAVDRASEQLGRTDAVTASMAELGDGMSELAGQVNALAGVGKAVAAGPVGRAAAVAYGVRHAVGLRRSRRAPSRTVSGRVAPGDTDPGKVAAATAPGQISPGKTRR